MRYNLEEELQKGESERYLAEIFPDRTPEYQEFIESAPVRMIERGYRRNISSGLMFYGLLKHNYPTVFGREIGVETLSTVGMNLVAYGKLDDASKMLEHNVKEFPNSARAHYELGDVYAKLGQTERAASEFEKALAIEPDHLDAREALDDLQE